MKNYTYLPWTSRAPSFCIPSWSLMTAETENKYEMKSLDVNLATDIWFTHEN